MTEARRADRLRRADVAEHAAYRRKHCPRVGSEIAKRGYSSPAAALRAAAQMGFASTMKTYECRCGQWHLSTAVKR